MDISTSRFGSVAIEPDDILLFPAGLPGLADCRHWVLLADGENDALGWLQCISRPEVALAVVSPRRFVPEYQLRVTKGELAPLQLGSLADAQVLAILAMNEDRVTVNLKGPLVIHLERRLGRQVVAADDQPVQYPLAAERVLLRKSA